MVYFIITDSIIVCPNNFRANQAPPSVNDEFTLEARTSDTSTHQGLALVKDGTFLGWMTRDSAGVAGQTGKIVDVESFFWIRGGGMCFRGNWEVLT